MDARCWSQPARGEPVVLWDQRGERGVLSVRRLRGKWCFRCAIRGPMWTDPVVVHIALGLIHGPHTGRPRSPAAGAERPRSVG